MSKRTGRLKLGAFLYPTGHHIASWRHPQAQADAGSNFTHYAELARIVETAKFDLIFMADGTPTQIVDQMEGWFTTGAADGFNVMPPHLPVGLTDFIEHVVPERRRRGLFRTEYGDLTLRSHLGLREPHHPAQSAVTAE